MPRIDFDETHRAATTNFDFPKLKLKNGQRARIVIGLENPQVEYVHTLRVPQIVNGVPQMGTEKRKDGTEYQDYKKDFLSRPICQGDFDVLQEHGSDEKNCPVCKLAKDHPDWVQPPQRRYAMHVLNYKIKAGTNFELTSPFSVEVLVWSFTDTIYNQILDMKNEWGDLRQHDLLLGPCTNETFQKFEINVGAKAEWLSDAARKSLAAETFKNNQIPDLTIAIGSKKEPRWLALDLDKIRDAWSIIEGSGITPGVTGKTEDTGDLDAALDGLLDGVGEVADEGSEPAADAGSDDLDSLLGTPDEPKAAPKGKAPAKAEPAPEPEVADTPEAGDSPANFDDLLADL